jgi:hypothetical protein
LLRDFYVPICRTAFHLVFISCKLCYVVVSVDKWISIGHAGTTGGMLRLDDRQAAQIRHRSGSVNINAGSTGAAHENV